MNMMELNSPAQYIAMGESLMIRPGKSTRAIFMIEKQEESISDLAWDRAMA